MRQRVSCGAAAVAMALSGTKSLAELYAVLELPPTATARPFLQFFISFSPLHLCCCMYLMMLIVRACRTRK